MSGCADAVRNTAHCCDSATTFAKQAEAYTHPSLLLSICLVLRLLLACFSLLGALLLSRELKHLCVRHILL